MRTSQQLVRPVAISSRGFRLGLLLEIERDGGADEFLQGSFIDLLAFVDVDRASDIPLKARIE